MPGDGNESDEDLTVPSLVSEEEMDAMSLGHKSDAGPMYTDM